MCIEYIVRNHEFVVILACFIFFRLMMGSGDQGLLYCDRMMKNKGSVNKSTISGTPQGDLIGFQGGDRILELLDPDLTSAFIHQRDVTNGRPHLLFVMYYSPSCDYCTNALPEFATAAAMIGYKGQKNGSDSNGVQFAVVNCARNEKTCRDEKIGGYPTFFLYKDGVLVEEYINLRTTLKFVEYLNEWKEKMKKTGWKSWIPFLS